MTPRETIQAYYRALREGEPLGPFFADNSTTVKYGISESLYGSDTIRNALRDQTEQTREWRVESRRLRVVKYDAIARFSDEVGLSWVDQGKDERISFETRWSGVLRSISDGPLDALDHHVDTPWRFECVHVSAPRDF